MTLSEKLYNLRRKQGLSQEGLAEKLDCSRQVISKWENGTTTPDAEMLTTLGLNSLELADLIVMCEERFGIVFEDEDLASLITLGDVVAYIEARV